MAIHGSLKPDLTEGKRLAGLTLRTDDRLLPAAADFVADIAVLYGIAGEEARRLNSVVHEVCRNAIVHGYEGRKDETIDIIAEERGHSLVLIVEDRGLPFDYQCLECGEDRRFSDVLTKHYADSVHFISLGKAGNRVEIHKHFDLEDIRDSQSPEDIMDAETASQAPEDEILTMRFMTADEARDLARVVYRCYGYSYSCDFVYFPEKVASRLDSGLMVSAVSLNPSNAIVGHLALNFHRPGARVAEAGQAVVDPRYRGHGIFKKLKLKLKDYAAENGILGIYSEAVTVHPYSQKGNLALGAHEIGFLLGYSPGTVAYQKIEEETHPFRQSVVFMYLPVGEAAVPPLHVPPSYRSQIEEIIKQVGLRRDFGGGTDSIDLPETGIIHLAFRPDHNQAWITVDEVGRDTADTIMERNHKIQREGIDIVYVDLPLDQPGSRLLGAALKEMGCIFGAYIPFYEKSDVLRLQKLNNVRIETKDIQVASDFGRRLLDTVLAEAQAAHAI